MYCDKHCRLFGLLSVVAIGFRVWAWQKKASSAGSVIVVASIFLWIDAASIHSFCCDSILHFALESSCVTHYVKRHLTMWSWYPTSEMSFGKGGESQSGVMGLFFCCSINWCTRNKLTNVSLFQFISQSLSYLLTSGTQYCGVTHFQQLLCVLCITTTLCLLKFAVAQRPHCVHQSKITS